MVIYVQKFIYSPNLEFCDRIDFDKMAKCDNDQFPQRSLDKQPVEAVVFIVAGSANQPSRASWSLLAHVEESGCSSTPVYPLATTGQSTVHRQRY